MEGASLNDLVVHAMDNGNSMSTVIRHWLPIVTFCPVNKLPDLIYISLEFNSFVELYAVRKAIRKEVSMKCMFMEDIAVAISSLYPSAVSVTVTLAFNRHIVKLENNNV